MNLGFLYGFDASLLSGSFRKIFELTGVLLIYRFQSFNMSIHFNTRLFSRAISSGETTSNHLETSTFGITGRKKAVTIYLLFLIFCHFNIERIRKCLVCKNCQENWKYQFARFGFPENVMFKVDIRA